MINKNYFLILFLSFLFSCGSENHKTENESESRPAVPIITAQIQTVSSISELSISGNIEGNKTVKLGFMVGGKIDYIAIQEGQTVSKGQVIARLDPISYTIAKEMADVQVRQISDEYNRLKIMHERNSISESDFKKVGFALEQAETQEKLHRQNLAYTVLYSPISGVLLKRLAETGEITGIGNPILVISDIYSVKMNAYIPENELHTVKIGQLATVRLASLDTTYNGKVTEIGSAADPASRAFTIKIEIENRNLAIRPGMIAEAKLVTGEAKTRVEVPGEAVLRDTDDKSYVYVVDKSQSKAFKRTIVPGQLIDNKIEVLKGLSVGDIIVIGGQQKLSDSVSVSIIK